MNYEQFALIADQEGLTVAIRDAMAKGLSRADAGLWEMRYLHDKAIPSTEH